MTIDVSTGETLDLTLDEDEDDLNQGNIEKIPNDIVLDQGKIGLTEHQLDFERSDLLVNCYHESLGKQPTYCAIEQTINDIFSSLK